MAVLTEQKLFTIDGLMNAKGWNVDPNRLEVLNPRTEPQIDDTTTAHFRYNHNKRRATSYLDRARSPRNSMYTKPDRPPSRNLIRRPLQRRTRYGNNHPLYGSLEDPGLFYGRHNFRNGRHKPVNENQSDGISYGTEGRMIMRQRGSVTLPYRGATVVSRPNTTTIFRSTQNRAARYNETKPHDGDDYFIDSNTGRVLTAEKEIAGSENICIKCPAERTVVAKRGRSQVVLQRPELRDCWGTQAPKNIYFKGIYGPKLGSLLPVGSHTTVGHIVYNNKTLQLCQYRVNVIVQTCQQLQVPSEILMHCPNGNIWGASCYFRCLKHNAKLNGAQMLNCNNDLSWSGEPPTCESKDWCDTPTAPNNGRLDCQTTYDESSNEPGSKDAFPQGTICKAQCNYHYVARQSIAKCIKGSWTATPTCRRQPQRRRLRHPRRSRNPIRL